MEGILKQFSLTGKKAMVTGAARGLCNGIAQALHDAGAEVVLIDVLDAVFESARVLGARGTPAHAVIGDMGDAQSRKQAFSQALDMLGGELDILVNGAGIQKRCEAADFSEEDWYRVVEIDLNAVFFMSQMAGRVMLKQGNGRIINISSLSATFGGLMIPAYTASKGGVAAVTRSLSNEWAGRGINVNAIAPGYFQTDLTATMRSLGTQMEEVTRRIPVGRWGTADDLKGLCVFLASEASAYVSGALIPCDGGYTAR